MHVKGAGWFADPVTDLRCQIPLEVAGWDTAGGCALLGCVASAAVVEHVHARVVCGQESKPCMISQFSGVTP